MTLTGRTSRTITRDDAVRVVRAALTEAGRQGARVSVVVLDASGAVTAVVRDDGVTETVTAIARAKANTALTLRTATADFVRAISANTTLFTALAAQPDIALMPGGVPLTDSDEVLGAIGVSGGRGDQDPTIALAAAAALGH
ncbi:GlcG/HbpS family heme-binding protein [Actinokineospora globicatena]|uniref:GlcG/HbpS family heme-binding protein n=1 Tax=Actinokineospora globicatena TaxID=103729 RepID=UPI0020A44467|nr:heme-binding protein [Actinokineospora globicatena]MCP2306751.1 Uncharacterized conserved protein GlcG, DUF336 family [Actinokineospora globicatena]GLW82130.1 hypothetical protein Aglo01_66110 [Actinokineospora globicatena]GLW88923.1 hypothetical protein Aglo02_65620 [Actinokineospora globicatena]